MSLPSDWMCVPTGMRCLVQLIWSFKRNQYPVLIIGCVSLYFPAHLYFPWNGDDDISVIVKCHLKARLYLLPFYFNSRRAFPLQSPVEKRNLQASGALYWGLCSTVRLTRANSADNRVKVVDELFRCTSLFLFLFRSLSSESRNQRACHHCVLCSVCQRHQKADSTSIINIIITITSVTILIGDCNSSSSSTCLQAESWSNTFWSKVCCPDIVLSTAPHWHIIKLTKHNIIIFSFFFSHRLQVELPQPWGKFCWHSNCLLLLPIS